MVHGIQWATSTEISVATRILQSNINSWLQGRDGHSNICFTKECGFASAPDHFKLLIKILKIIMHKMVSSFIRQALQYRNILYYNKNKIQIQMSILFPDIFETKQYFLCWIFVFYICVRFVSLILFPDVDDFSCGCFLFSCFFSYKII
jgi:hypothetical protein